MAVCLLAIVLGSSVARFWDKLKTPKGTSVMLGAISEVNDSVEIG